MLRAALFAAAMVEACVAFAPGAVFSRQVQQQRTNALRVGPASAGLATSRRAAAMPALAAGASMQMQGAGKAVVITGAAGGVGYAYADKFLENGMKVVIAIFPPKSPTRRLLSKPSTPEHRFG